MPVAVSSRTASRAKFKRQPRKQFKNTRKSRTLRSVDAATLDGAFLAKEAGAVYRVYQASYSREPVRNFSAISPDTRLETLNLNWKERDLPERIRTKHVHRLHPYLGKFIPQLVEVFLRKYFRLGQTVLDPFVGSGTTLVQANELGIHSIGCDISAFNILLCKAKTMQYDVRKVTMEVHDVLEKTRRKAHANLGEPDLWSSTNSRSTGNGQAVAGSYLSTWFHPRALFELLAYRDLVNRVGYQYSDLLKVILCRSARSARLTTHYDLDFPKVPQRGSYWCFKHSRRCSPVSEALKFLERYSIDSIDRIREYAQLRTGARTELHHGDSRELALSNLDGVITSPPYVGLIDYHEQHSYAYHLLELEDRRQREIGPAVQGSGYEAQRRYQAGIADAFVKVIRGMPSGGHLIVVANDRLNLYGAIAETVGVKVEAVINRHVNRRTGRRSGEFYESVFVWRKP